MIVTSTEFKSNIGKYLGLVEREEIVITKNGKQVAKLVEAHDKSDLVKSLKGILPPHASLAQAKDERLAKR